MKLIKKFLDFIKNIFKKEEQIKMIEAPQITSSRNNFVNSIKVKLAKKSKVETLICYGDGLGIKNKISY